MSRLRSLFTALLWLACAIPASATTFVVSNSNDSGPGSLRDAITQANADVNATPVDPDTLLLTKDVITEIAPKTPFPTLMNHMTFIGPDSLTAQIKGAKTFRAFSVAAGATVRMINLRLSSATSPDVGGYLLNAGDLTLVNVNIRNCDTQRTGAAIENVGTLTLINSWFDKNKVHGPPGPQDGGGAISNDEPGVLTAYNCTFSNNVCTKGGFGGTIRSASAGGVWLDHCTIALGDTREPTPAGGGIATLGTGVTHLNNTIVIGSVHGGDLFGPVQSELGHNLFGTTAGATLAGSTDGNIVGALMSSVLEPTLEHNGVSGRTHALIPGSPALDAGVADASSPALATDARGFARPANGAADIGAFEEQQPLGPNLVTNASFEGTLHGWEEYENATVAVGAGGLAGAASAHIVATGGTLDDFGLNDTPYWLNSTVAGQRYRFSALVRSSDSHGSAWLQLREYNCDQRQQRVNSPAIQLTPDWQLVTTEITALKAHSKVDFQVVDSPKAPTEDFDVDVVSIVPVLGPDTPPRVLAPPFATAYVGLPLQIDVSAYDPDGDTLALIAADVSGLPSPAAFTASPDNRSGRFLWTPLTTDTTGSPFPVIFSAENVRTGHVITSIRVLPAPPNLVTNSGLELDTSGWGRYGSPTLSLSPDAHSGTSAMLVTGRAGSTSSFGAVADPATVAVVDGAGSRYRFMAWVKGASGAGLVKLRVREFNAGSQVGETQYSPEIPLDATWRLLSVDVAAQMTGSSLEFRVTEAPSVAGSSFLVDDVVVIETGAAPAPVTTLGRQPANGGEPELIVPSESGTASALRLVPAATASAGGFRTLAFEGLTPAQESNLPTATLHVGALAVMANPLRTRLGDDADGNGIEEVSFSFPEAVLPAQGGRADLEILTGASLALHVPVELDRGPEALVFNARVSQSPVRSEGTLVFTTTLAGPVRVMLFDTSGRRVEMLDDEANADPGRHTVTIGGRDAALRSGMYFYRILAREGELDGRFALIR